MTRAQLFQYFKDSGITMEEVAEKTGYSTLYLTNIFYGNDRLNDRMRFKILRAYPDTAAFLLPAQPGDNGGNQEGE